MPDPIIYRGAADTGYSPAPGADMWGAMPDVRAVTFHHSAGPRATSKDRAIALHKAYQRSHIDRGFGDIGYHFSLDDRGRFYVLRDVKLIGSHVGQNNTGNVGIMVHGNYMFDKLNDAQHNSLRWLFTGGFLKLIGEREEDITLVRGHKEWPGHTSNDCPGTDLMRRISYLRSEEFR